MFKALGSTVLSTLGILSSFQTETEWGLRVLALALGGIAVPVVTMWSIMRKAKQKDDKKD